MKTGCVVVNEEDLSSVKALVAKRLHESGRTQADISRSLNVTQPMVSKYLGLDVDESVFGGAANHIFGMIEGKKRGRFYSVFTEEEDYTTGAVFLEKKESGEKEMLISSLSGAGDLLKKRDLSSVLPKVKVNIAFALTNAKSRDDVVAIPSGLIFVKGSLRDFASPEFGCSGHLSELLVSMIREEWSARSVMNVKFSDDVFRRIKRDKLSYAFVDDSYTLPKKHVDVLIHKGSFGIEPTTYVLGKDPLDVVRRVMSLA